MIKLSKESKTTFMCLLIVPVIWVTLNHFGYLDYLKTKSLDWRIQARGEIKQLDSFESGDLIQVENNLTLPRVPKVAYVNFDAATLAMDGVGERPWDRAFFRDTALALIEKGNARVLGFDFGFTPKSMSKMVPVENSFRSDMAMGELVKKYPNRVVLGCLYSGVQTTFVKPAGVSAFPPFFYDGFSLEDSINSKKFHYPESPTYPLVNYLDNNYVGRMGSFTVPPFRAVDEIPRWVPLWFPSMGKAHAYNLLGGKQSKLELELPKENRKKIEKLNAEMEIFDDNKSKLEMSISRNSVKVSDLQSQKADLSQGIALLELNQQKIEKWTEEISNFKNTLAANPGLSNVINPQLETRIKNRDLILVKYLDDSNISLPLARDELVVMEEKIQKLEQEIQNFQNTLEANPTMGKFINPQIESRSKQRVKLLKEVEISKKKEDFSLTEKQRSKATSKIKESLLQFKKKEATLLKELSKEAISLSNNRELLVSLREKMSEFEIKLNKLNGKTASRLVETKDKLRLVYASSEGEASNELVDSLPNEVPLFRDRKIFALGVESLLAYYDLEDDAVEIGDDGSFKILSKQGETLVNCQLEEKQFLEVNWFTKWTETLQERTLMKAAKKAYVEDDLERYLKLIPTIIKNFLDRVEGFQLNDNADLPENLRILGLETELVEISRLLLGLKGKNERIPSFDELTRVVEGIAYYFIPPSLKSSTNPMCGMRDVLQNAKFQDQVLAKIQELEEKIVMLNGPEVMGKLDAALLADPENQGVMAQKRKVEEAIGINSKNLFEQKEELKRINEFFGCFKDSIVLLGPEEKTFQDLAPTPFDKASVPKVSVHGNLIKTMTTGKYISRPPKSMDHLATLLVCLIMGLLSVYQGNRASLVQAAGILLLVGYVIFGFFTFSKTQFLLPITAPTCAGLSTSFIGLAAMVVIEQKAKGKLKGMFGSYVSSDLVEQMVESGEEPSLGGEETAITAFFSDVQSFSSFSELLTPTGLVDLMNEYLTAMTNILQEERGTLDKYIGDAIVAMYGAPIPMKDHAYQSVKTAILMQQKQIELREKWKYEEEKWGKCHGLVSQMQTRIGCNTGTATVGNMGALDRFNYTMMGDMVNLAARCESGAKAYGAYIMVTEETKLDSEKTKDDIAFRYLDKIVVKGRSQPVAMFEPTGFMSELDQETQDCLDCFRQGIDKYLLQDWDGALSLFEKAKNLEPNKPGVTPGVKDNPSMILIDRFTK